MSNTDYVLEIISHHPQFSNKELKKYYVDGIDTVGAWGDEPFEIRFRNLSWSKVQVKISLDGTDILTGKLADTLTSDDMWVVNPLSTLSIKAWPETNNGGAGFVFTSAANSVAVHTHGNLSNRGIIAAAVFTEGHVEPVRVTDPINHHYHHYHYYNYPIYTNPYYNPHYTWCTTDYTYGEITMGGRGSSIGSISGTTADLSAEPTFKTNANNLVAIGAGQYVDQQITNVSGLVKPVFSQTVRVRYLWWDDLVSKLREQSVAEPHPSGFPADKKQTNINLGSTPRIGQKINTTRKQESFLRV